MFEELFFWKKWDREFKSIYQLLLLLTLILIGVYLVGVYLGSDIALDWLTTFRLESKTIQIGINNIFGIPSAVSTDLSVIQQYFEGSALKLSETTYYLYLTVFCIGLTVCLTIVTYLKRFFFLVSTALFIFLLFLIRLNTLALFGLEGNESTILFFALFVPLSYYFHDINTEVSLKNRLLIFMALMLVCGITIHFFSQAENPFLSLATNIFIPAVIFTIVFILLVGYEIVYTILIITTQSNQDSKTNNTRHFIIFSLIYLINVILAYAHNAGKIDWDIYYINAFVLFIISAVLGIWGLRDREVLYGKTMPFYPYTGILYLALAIISISTITFHMAQANDSILETFEDSIIFGHIGFGFFFLLYIIGNFISLLLKNLPVYKIAFKEDNFPYVSARLAGIITVAGLFFLSNKAALNQAIAGYFISQGDYNHLQKKPSPAIENYRYASMYAPNNHKSNYALSKMQSTNKDARKFVLKATKKNPTPYAYINTGLNYIEDGKFFDALFIYQAGVAKFPNSNEIKNNLAVLYGSTTVLDSAIYYLNDISDSKTNTKLNNKLALSVLKDVDFHESFPSNEVVSSDGLDVNANMLAKLLLQPDSILKAQFFKLNQTQLNLISYAYINNLGIWSYSNPNSNYLPLVESVLINPSNDKYKEQLLFMKALNLYNGGRVKDAYHIISQLINTYITNGVYAYIAGLWSIEQNSPRLAQDFLEQAIEQGSQDAKIFLPLAFWLNNQQDKATDYLNNAFVNDTIRDGRLTKVGQITSSDNASIKQRNTENFKNIVSLPASDVLDEITIAESEKDLIRTEELYRLLGNLNPFFAEGVLAAVSYFNEVNQDEQAYDILVDNMEVNPYSEELVKAYIDQCFAMGLENYAETGLLKLLDILSKEEYDQYEIVFDLKKEQLQQEDLNW